MPWWKIFIPILMLLSPWNVTPKALSIVPDKTLTVEVWSLPGCDYVSLESEKQTGVTQSPLTAKCYFDPVHGTGMTASGVMHFGGTGYVYRLIAVPYKNGARVYTPSRISVEGWWFMGTTPPAGTMGNPYPAP